MTKKTTSQSPSSFISNGARTKQLLLLSLLALASFAPHVLAQAPCTDGTFCALAPITNLTDGSVTGTLDANSLATFFNNLYKYLIGLAATLAVIEIIWGGLEISTKDSVSKQSDGKERITQAIFGLVLVLSPVLVFSIINPSIINLSLNLPPIDLHVPAVVGGGGGGGGGPIVDPATGCTVSGTSGILQFASCPSSATSLTWGQSCSGNLSIGDSVTKADGTVISIMTMCTGSQKYTFIDLGTSALTGAMTRLQPLAITTDNPNNASSAIQFASICQSIGLGLETCVSDAPVFTFATDCLPTPKTTMPAGTAVPAKCYKETLTCERILGSSQKCSGSPSWTPFQ